MKPSAPLIVALLIWPFLTMAAEMSPQSSDCLECHAVIHPGIVTQWEKSRHAKISVEEALNKPLLERRVSLSEGPDGLATVVVGCAECHMLNPEQHKDTFKHAEYDVHTVVTPEDCATCHPTEAEQYRKNLMSHAYGNLVNNPVFQSLADSSNSIQVLENMEITTNGPDDLTDADSCLACHGTKVEVKGTEVRDTFIGEMEFPILSGWPNQGSGRINPDGSMGACTICHTRHQFPIEMARKPHTCSECHKGPDVPAYPVYQVSKHGNTYSSLASDWEFMAVPWTVGKDFGSPTCAVCHISLLVDTEGEVIAERTHQMSNRLPWRIFGLIYAHPHPKEPDTTMIKNKAGLPLPTELTGEPAAEHLIDAKEQETRREVLQKVCLSCHSSSWVKGHWDRFENTLRTTNEMTIPATKVVMTAWEKGVAKGLAQKDSIFNEAIERKWVEQWLFYANSTRFASAMMGGDYGVHERGRWFMSSNLREMMDWLEFKTGEKGESE
jgi:hydroxylamine dehydrogenase